MSTFMGMIFKNKYRFWILTGFAVLFVLLALKYLPAMGFGFFMGYVFGSTVRKFNIPLDTLNMRRTYAIICSMITAATLYAISENPGLNVLIAGAVAAYVCRIFLERRETSSTEV